MFAEAVDKRLWFKTTGSNGDIVVSPSELQAEQALGNMLWFPVNWTLIDPTERVRELERHIADAQSNLKAFRERYGADLKKFRR